MNYQKRATYITFLAIIVLIFIYYNKMVIIESLTVTSSSPVISESDAYTDNKDETGEIAKATTYNTLDDVTSQIQECRTIIDEINRVIPRRIQDITIGTVNQTDNLDQIGITIEQGVTPTLNPITNETDQSGTWKINAILPRGKQGPIGLKGPKGNTGTHGPPGIEGKQGRKGPWGKDCSNNSCN